MKVFMCLRQTSVGPVFSTMEKAKEYFIHQDEKLENHDFINGDYPCIQPITIDSKSFYMDR